MTRMTEGTNPGRDIMLDLLKGQRGEWVSGQILAGRLDMTRAAIWKRIGLLKEQGYGIDASPRKGYRLRDIPDRLLASEIRDGLKTCVIGQRDIHHFERTDSTNKRAKEIAAAGAGEGALVVAEEQTRGRGRLDRHWFSPAGQGIYLSVVLRPALPPSEAARLVLLAAVAVAETLIDTAGLKATIKWPNDVLVGGKKIAGILTELAMEMDAVDYVIIGLGLNVNMPADQWPEDIRGRATSVLAETGQPFSRPLLLRHLLESFENGYEELTNAGFEPIMARWRDLADMLGRKVSVQARGGSYSGEVVDFDPDGFMILRDNNGRDRRILSGDVTIL